MENEVTIQSWAHLQDELLSDSWDGSIGRFRSRFAYRGMDNESFSLNTTLMRLGGNYNELEPHLIRNFSKYAYRDVVEKDNLWHWITIAQHHGLPTRLLDWTSSPLVAAHFATANIDKFDSDGVIWMVKYQGAHAYLPDELQDVLRSEGANLFTIKMLSRTIPGLKELANLAKDPFPIFLEPPSIDDRIVNQHSLFSLFSRADISVNQWLSDKKELWKKVIIPSSLKWEVRDKLDQSNITERVLFPGLDGLSQWLKRYYSPNKEQIDA